MNERLMGEFLQRASKAPEGQRGQALISIVAEHCATICDLIVDNGESPKGAAETIRAAFVAKPPKMKATAAAARHAARMQGN